MPNNRDSTMIIIPTTATSESGLHLATLADPDYGKITTHAGNYDDFMSRCRRAREQAQNANAKAKERIAELQDLRSPLHNQRPCRRRPAATKLDRS